MLKPPGQFSPSMSGDAQLLALDHEVAGEKAASLGRAGRRVEETLAKLRAHDGDGPERVFLLKDAAEAVYAFFIQRELCGMRRHHDVIRDYGIPGAVLARLGAR